MTKEVSTGQSRSRDDWQKLHFSAAYMLNRILYSLESLFSLEIIMAY